MTVLLRQNQCVTHRVCAAHPKAAPTQPAGPRTQTACLWAPCRWGRLVMPRPAVSLVLCLPGCAFAPCLLEAPSSHSGPGLPWVASWVPSTCQALWQLKCSVVFTSCHRSPEGFEGESVSSVQELCVPTHRGRTSCRCAGPPLPQRRPSRPHPGPTLQTRRGSTRLSLPGLRWLPEVRAYQQGHP